MNKNIGKKYWKAVVAFVIVLALVLPGSSMLASFEETIHNEISSSNVDGVSLQSLDDSSIGTMESTDWWPMFCHDLENTGYSTSTAPDIWNVDWMYDFKSNGLNFECIGSSPAVVDGKMYIGVCYDRWPDGYGIFYCLDITDGHIIWNYTVDDWVRTCAAVADGKVYFGSENNKMYCLDATDGSFIWEYATGGCVFSAPTVAYGNVYFGSNDYNLYCLNATDGSFIWKYTTGDDVYSSPAVAYGNVYFGSLTNERQIYCLNATDGSFIWSYYTGGSIISSPVIADGKLYVGNNVPWTSVGPDIYCLNALDGTFIWSVSFDDTANTRGVSSPTVVDGKVYIGTRFDYWPPPGFPSLYCLNATDGSFIWSHLTYGDVSSSPAVADGKIYVYSREQVHPPYAGYIFCMDIQDGSLIWKYNVENVEGNYPLPLRSGGKTYIWPSPAIANGRVFAASVDDGHIYCFGPDDTTPPLILDIKAMPRQAYGYVNISATVIDNIEIDDVYLHILYPDSSIENFSITQNKTGDTYYCNRTYIQNGVYTFHIWASDTNDHDSVSTSYTFEILEDTIPPVTTCDLDGILIDDVYVTDVTVTLTATDSLSGVNYTMYKLNDGEWQEYSDSFVVSENGEHIVYFYSVDFVENIEPEKSRNFIIQKDIAPPVTTHEFDPSNPNGENGWYDSDVTITLNATDDISGVDVIYYRLNDGEEWNPYTAPVEVCDDGEYGLEYYSIDNAGNIEEVKDPFDLKIDQTSPEIELTVKKTGFRKWRFTATVSDDTSGINRVEFYYDGELLGMVTEDPYEWVYSGTYGENATAVAYDNAGNSELDTEPVSYSLQNRFQMMQTFREWIVKILSYLRW